MAELKHEEVFKEGVEVLTVQEFAEKHGDGVKKQAIYYAANKGLVDYLAIGGSKFIVMTNHTKQYKPNPSPNRSKPLGKKPKKK